MRSIKLFASLLIFALFSFGGIISRNSSLLLKELVYQRRFNNEDGEHLYAQTVPVEVLPDWRVLTDCSSFRDGCAARRIANGRIKYEEYPFTFDDDFDDKYEWINMSNWPKEWNKIFVAHGDGKETNSNNTTPVATHKHNDNAMAGYVYPPLVDQEKVDRCLKSAKTLPYQEQLKNIVKSIKRDIILNDMVAFTITDIKYARDMIHDVIEMNDNVVGFGGAFFIVALDKETVKLGCQHGYPIIAGPGVYATADKGLEDNVRNTKFQISYDLTMMNQTFFFYEMDVWFVKSPKQLIFEQQIRNKDNPHNRVDMFVSSHQNNPQGMNIGVYSVLANKATQEYFRLCLHVSSKVKMHDQVIMGRIDGWISEIRHLDGKERNEKLYSLVEAERTNEGSDVPTDFPNITVSYLIQSKLYGGHIFAASGWPLPTKDTIAVHTLCGAPLREPHGKIMTAKELGVYHGFSNTVAGYYHRTGQYRRYILLDGRQVGYSFVENFNHEGWGVYHEWDSFGWTMATLIALAQHTDRILILPRFIHDNGETFVWEFLDMEPIEELGVQIRETNFISNPKAWYSDTTPFKSVARIALGSDDPTKKIYKMFAEYSISSQLKGSKKTNKDSQKQQSQQLAWKILSDTNDKPKERMHPIDLWFALPKSIPEIDNAEALLVNPHDYHRQTDAQGSKVVTRILEIYNKLRWCKDAMENFAGRHGTPLVTPDHDCYGKGEKTDWTN